MTNHSFEITGLPTYIETRAPIPLLPSAESCRESKEPTSALPALSPYLAASSRPTLAEWIAETMARNCGVKQGSIHNGGYTQPREHNHA